MSEYLKDALKGAAKTKTKFGKPDFYIEKYKLSIIENKKGISKLLSKNKDGVKFEDTDIANYAVNGALHYSRAMIDSGKYEEVIAIGVAGNSNENVKMKIYYVFGSGINAYKELHKVSNFNFLENNDTAKKYLVKKRNIEF